MLRTNSVSQQSSSRLGIGSALKSPLSTLLLATLVVPGGLVEAGAQEPRTSSPNLLVFVADDLGWRDLGVQGNTAIRTPNLDRLAGAGLRVVHAFGTSPQCSPSRISTLSGRYAHATRTEDLHTPLPRGVRLLPSFLQANGYFTGLMAKTHIGPAGDRQFQWYSPKLAEAFPEFLDSAGTRPFLLWVGFHDPHRPYQRGTLSQPHAPARVKVPPYLVDEPRTRADLALYYDEIARMDGEIGRMLAELDRRALGARTLVVFFSDNGAPFPREKGTLYDPGTRTPLILSWPSVIPAGWMRASMMLAPADASPAQIR